MGKHLTLSQLGLGAAPNDGGGNPLRTGGATINANVTATEAAHNALAGRYWLLANTARALVLGDRVQSDDHAGIAHALPATFVYDPEGLNDIWLCNHDNASDVAITPASGDEIYMQGVSLGVDVAYALNPGQLAILSIRADNTSWNMIVFTQMSGSGAPVTTKGDLYGYSTTDARIPVGANGTMLTADSAETLGVKWSAIDPSAMINVQSGVTYTIQASDNGKEVVFTNAAAIAVTLPDGLATNFHCVVSQAGAGVPTVTPDTDTVNGAGTGVAPAAQWKGMYLAKYAAATWMAKF